ncbi:CGNR zinc finger domain-containing protein [Cellulomonas sp. DKR-3]|uniref:CGNR zinc finger domain-containing protein n=2 Tax=Cellulomonas fulva TaxID=2835530 RepID=A0ABS5TUJ6_9CELL|nr:CGNR zinc finger domain-containing protein [Cellulomonas fulva]
MLGTVPPVNTLEPWITLGTEPGVAPGRLERVRALLNTDDRFHGVERLGAQAPAGLRELRDGLRAYVVAGEQEALDRVAAGHRLVLRVTADGPALVPSDEEDHVAGLLVDVLEEHRAGRLQRLKACANPACQWVYYDASRNRSGRWCSMGECGDVMKARAYRARSRAGA